MTIYGHKSRSKEKRTTAAAQQQQQNAKQGKGKGKANTKGDRRPATRPNEKAVLGNGCRVSVFVIGIDIRQSTSRSNRLEELPGGSDTRNKQKNDPRESLNTSQKMTIACSTAPMVQPGIHRYL